MRSKIIVFLLTFFLWSCKTTELDKIKNEDNFVIAFGSCNKTELPNDLWDDVLEAHPNVWIWGGDNIYADTDDMIKMQSMYNDQKNVPGYKKLLSRVPVLGTWDDHDYGINDGGEEFSKKVESQKLFFDFIGIEDKSIIDSPGIYMSKEFSLPSGIVKVIVLDTRYFRTQLTEDTETKKRYKPNVYGEGTILGNQQWNWLTDELNTSTADFNIIVSSIQFLSNEHGYEAWGNFPHEVDRFESLIRTSGANNVIMLSGDRHISEFSKKNIEGLAYPLIDFTSSGLTHSYEDFTSENNPFRIGNVVSDQSFGVLRIDLKTKKVMFEIRGNANKLLGKLKQSY